MSATASISDAELLQSYERGNNEAAFSALVERYQSMVLGAAFRKTGNLELAREVAQEVFAALARKARFLSTRVSVGGWLHQAAIYQAARTLQSEARRYARHERFAEEAPRIAMPVSGAGNGSDHLAVIDEALGHLSSADREVIVLHYFQDLSYPEMAKVLGVNEPAVRQRVSRALERLGKRLREQGVTGNVIVLLFSAVAIQTTMAAPAGLTSAALATAAAGGGYSAYLLLTAILSPVAIKTAAVLLAVSGVAALWYEAPILHRSVAQNAELPSIQGSDPRYASLKPTITEADLPAADAFRSRGQSVAGAVPAQPLTAGPAVTQLAGRDAQSPALASGASRIAPPQTSVTSPPRPGTSKVSLAAKDSSKTSSEPRSSDPSSSFGDSGLPSDPLPSSPEFHFPGVLGEIAELGGLPAVIDELRRVELLPGEAAKLYGELLEDVLSLQPVERTLVEGLLEDHYERLNEQGIAGIRPPEIAQETWRTLREVESSELVNDLQKVLSTAAPDPEKLNDLLTLADKPDSHADSPQSGSMLQPVADTIQTVTDTVQAASGTVQTVSDSELLPLPDLGTATKLPLLK